MTDRFAGKTVLVTGAGSGIGRACAEKFVGHGATVVATDLDAERLATLQKECVGSGSLRTLQQNVADEAQWNEVMASVQQTEGALHVLVNNAGIAWAGSILDMTLDDWRHQNSVNLDGVFLGVRSAIPLLLEAGGGAIVNISSVAGFKGSPTLAGYCASKGGVRLFTKAIAQECLQKQWPIRINSVHPGVIDTAIWGTVTPSSLAPGANSFDVEELAQSMAVHRAGHPSEIADGVVYLASEEASYVHGTELVIDAGVMA